jgi:hypothetical protein
VQAVTEAEADTDADPYEEAGEGEDADPYEEEDANTSKGEDEEAVAEVDVDADAEDSAESIAALAAGVAEGKQQERMIKRVLLKMKMRALAGSFAGWVDAVATKKHHRMLVARRKKRAAATALLSWVELRARRKWLRRFLHELHGTWSNRELTSGFAGWFQNTHQRDDKDERQKAAVEAQKRRETAVAIDEIPEEDVEEKEDGGAKETTAASEADSTDIFSVIQGLSLLDGSAEGPLFLKTIRRAELGLASAQRDAEHAVVSGARVEMRDEAGGRRGAFQTVPGLAWLASFVWSFSGAEQSNAAARDVAVAIITHLHLLGEATLYENIARGEVFGCGGVGGKDNAEVSTAPADDGSDEDSEYGETRDVREEDGSGSDHDIVRDARKLCIAMTAAGTLEGGWASLCMRARDAEDQSPTARLLRLGGILLSQREFQETAFYTADTTRAMSAEVARSSLWLHEGPLKTSGLRERYFCGISVDLDLCPAMFYSSRTVATQSVAGLRMGKLATQLPSFDPRAFVFGILAVSSIATQTAQLVLIAYLGLRCLTMGSHHDFSCASKGGQCELSVAIHGAEQDGATSTFTLFDAPASNVGAVRVSWAAGTEQLGEAQVVHGGMMVQHVGSQGSPSPPLPAKSTVGVEGGKGAIKSGGKGRVSRKGVGKKERGGSGKRVTPKPTTHSVNNTRGIIGTRPFWASRSVGQGGQGTQQSRELFVKGIKSVLKKSSQILEKCEIPGDVLIRGVAQVQAAMDANVRITLRADAEGGGHSKTKRRLKKKTKSVQEIAKEQSALVDKEAAQRHAARVLAADAESSLPGQLSPFASPMRVFKSDMTMCVQHSPRLGVQSYPVSEAVLPFTPAVMLLKLYSSFVAFRELVVQVTGAVKAGSTPLTGHDMFHVVSATGCRSMNDVGALAAIAAFHVVQATKEEEDDGKEADGKEEEEEEEEEGVGETNEAGEGETGSTEEEEGRVADKKAEGEQQKNAKSTPEKATKKKADPMKMKKTSTLLLLCRFISAQLQMLAALKTKPPETDAAELAMRLAVLQSVQEASNDACARGGDEKPCMLRASAKALADKFVEHVSKMLTPETTAEDDEEAGVVGGGASLKKKSKPTLDRETFPARWALRVAHLSLRDHHALLAALRPVHTAPFKYPGQGGNDVVVGNADTAVGGVEDTVEEMYTVASAAAEDAIKTGDVELSAAASRTRDSMSALDAHCEEGGVLDPCAVQVHAWLAKKLNTRVALFNAVKLLKAFKGVDVDVTPGSSVPGDLLLHQDWRKDATNRHSMNDSESGNGLGNCGATGVRLPQSGLDGGAQLFAWATMVRRVAFAEEVREYLRSMVR